MIFIGKTNNMEKTYDIEGTSVTEFVYMHTALAHNIRSAKS